MVNRTRTILQQLDMLSRGNGLFRVSAEGRSSGERKILETHEWRARLESFLIQAGNHGADWVYFRLDCEAGGPKPEVFIYDRSSTMIDADNPSEVGRLHLELWNYGKVPLAFIFRPVGVDVFNLLQPPEFAPSGLISPKPLDFLPLAQAETLALAGAAAKGIAANQDQGWRRFSGRNFDNGSFWEAPENRDLGSGEKSSMATMVKEMRLVRDRLEKEFARHPTLPEAVSKDAKPFVRRLLILTLMVRFMEECGIIPPDYFENGTPKATGGFKSLLGSPKKLLKALDRLAKDFNGDIFRVADRKGEVPIRSILKTLAGHEEVLRPIAEFADGSMKGEQRYFWERYSFRHLPVEAISYVYEDFLDGKSQSYFTPHHLVDLLLDEAMPSRRVRAALEANPPKQKNSSPAFAVLDPSCGSGVFLVGAWQRLVEAFRLVDATPTPERLKLLMEQNIHGVDKEPDSVELTIFSLCVALCSTFPEKENDPGYTFRKLQELKFPNLKSDATVRRNIDLGDFFTRRKVLLADRLRFQVIIGNPPFESVLTEEATLFDRISTDEAGKTWEPVPDNNIAYLFLRAVPPLLTQGGRACLVQNAGLIYNTKPHAFRKSLFGNWHVPAILDFASISGLFKTRTPTKRAESESEKSVGVKTVAVVIDHREPEFNSPVLHVTFRRTYALQEREVFEIDPQDLHWIPRALAATESRVWKANLLGGGRLLETYQSLISGRSFGQYLAELERDRGWIQSEGVITADVGSYGKEASGAKRRYKPQHRPEYASLDMINTEGLSNSGIDPSRISKSNLEWFLWPRDRRLFDPPHILIKEHELLPFVIREEGEPLLFRNEIVGIKAPVEDTQILREIAETLAIIRHNFPFFAAFGPRYLTGRQSAVLKKDIMDLPFPENSMFLFRGIQKHLRDDVLNFMIPLIKDNQRTQAELACDSKPKEVTDYVKVYLEVMHSAFPDLKISSKPLDLGRAWLVAFHRGNEPPADFGDTESLVEHLDGLLVKEMGKSLRCMRIVRHFHGKSLYILKPKPRRYWLKSAAIRDADEMFAWWAAQSAKKAKTKA